MTNHQGSFHTHPQRFPKARKKAADVANQIEHLMSKGPRTLVATVADTSYHTTQGYIVGTTQLGSSVNIYGVPYGTVVNGMRVFCRQIGGKSTLRSFIFDGYAVNLSGTGFAGSFGYTSPVSSLSTGLAITNSTGTTTSASVTGPFGYYFFFFFYMPQLPTNTVTLWQMNAASGGNVLNCEYLPNGKLQIRSQDNHGYLSNAPISAHNIHYCVLQPGVGSQFLLVDNVANYTGLAAPSDNPTFGGASVNYQVSLLSRSDGTQLCPLGSWISKFSFGTCWNGVNAVALQSLGSGLGSVPTTDLELPSAIPQTDCTLLYQLLCEDAAGSTTLADSAGMGGTSAAITLGGSVLANGPY
jgi:hypothetical protein